MVMSMYPIIQRHSSFYKELASDNFTERTKGVRKVTKDRTTLFKYVCIHSVSNEIQNCYYILDVSHH